MELMLGKNASIKIKEDLKNKLEKLPRKLTLVSLVNEEDASSLGYCASQEKNANALGINYKLIKMPSDENAYLSKIKEINEDDLIDGCLITRPLFKGANEEKIIGSLNPLKDVDAMNAYSLGELFINKENAIKPATANAIMTLIEEYNIDVCGKNVLVVGRSVSVGKPVAMMLLNKNATVTIAHSKTSNLDELLSKADIVVVAIGKPHFIDSNKMKQGVIVVDAGIHYLESGIVGDVIPSDKCSLISKVPGGVGIITSALLMQNVYSCYKRRKQND